MWKRKPKRWIEKFQVTCKDDLHDFLMREFGFEEYLRCRLWEFDLERLKKIHSLNFSFQTLRAIEAEVNNEDIPLEYIEASVNWGYDNHWRHEIDERLNSIYEEFGKSPTSYLIKHS